MTEHATVSAFLETQHRWIDERFERFRQSVLAGQIDAEPFLEAATALHRHIYLEEEILFPEVEARGLVGPTAVMAQEHGEICRFLGGIQDLIRTNAEPPRVGGAFTALLGLLEEHNFKEERVLYPSADQLLDPWDRARLLEQLKEAQVPESWRCRTHRATTDSSFEETT